MKMDVEYTRRTIVVCVAALALYGAVVVGSPSAVPSPSASLEGARRKPYAAVAFDYFVLFNPDSVVSAVERVFPGKGRAFTDIWRTRQFEYSWLRSLAGRYVDFSVVTEDALVYAASTMKVRLTVAEKRQLLDAYLQLAPWPDGVGEVRFLWVDEPSRHTGIGSRLLRAAEEEARSRGCYKMVLSTHSFQAPDFYLKHGYVVAGEFSEYPRGHRSIFLEKLLR